MNLRMKHHNTDNCGHSNMYCKEQNRNLLIKLFCVDKTDRITVRCGAEIDPLSLFDATFPGANN